MSARRAHFESENKSQGWPRQKRLIKKRNRAMKKFGVGNPKVGEIFFTS